jgi:hypothetical protein
MTPVMDAPAIDTTPPMAERLFALLLASGRAFTLLPDGSVQVPTSSAPVTPPQAHPQTSPCVGDVGDIPPHTPPHHGDV